MGKNTIFVSYRRTDLNGKTSGTDIARTIKQHLEISGYENRVFFDYSELSDDEFENIILSEIRGCKVFILVLTHDTMHRCVDDDDWVRREILEAAKHNIKIIPIEVDNLFNGYPKDMISDLNIIKRLQHSKVHMDSSFENDMNAIIEARIAPVTKPRKSNKLKHILIALFAIIALVVAGWLIAKASNSVSDVAEPESKPIQEYVSVSTNDQWRPMSTPNSSYMAYESFSNYCQSSRNATMSFTIRGYSEYTFYIRSNGESGCDYVMVGLDREPTTSNNIANTSNGSSSGESISSYKRVYIPNLNEEQYYTINVVYRKDSSYSYDPDRGYVLIPYAN